MDDLGVKFTEYGLVDINRLDPTIKVNLNYASNTNFLNRNVYGNLKSAYLEYELAKRVVLVQKEITKYNDNLSLLILDAARPISIQQKMYKIVEGTPQSIYVADPKLNGGFHNYGMAVDLTIIDKTLGNLDMGSDFDFFGEESHVGVEIELFKQNKISLQAVKNRYLLYSFMLGQNLFPHPNEWWHYQYHTEESDKLKYRLLDF